jgi:dipeptidyl aminopeptidase/acylaminoacyl peptidase
MKSNRFAATVLGALALSSCSILFPAPPAKRALTHQDYDAWRTIAGPVLSPDGRYLAYSFLPQEGDGDIVVRDLRTGSERRETVGALPPPPLPTGDEVNPEGPPGPRSVRVLITSDSRFLIAGSYPAKAETDRARKERRRPEEMPKPGLMILELATGDVTRVAAVRSMQVPSRGGPFLAYLLEPRAEERPGGDGSTPRGAGRAGGPARREYGTDLVVRDLAGRRDRVIPNVSEYSIAQDGGTLLYAVAARTEEENGVYAVVPGSDAPAAALLAGKGRYSKIAWDRESTRAAFVSDRDDAGAKVPKLKLYLWDRKSPAALEVVSASTAGLPAALAVSDKAAPSFSRDGAKLYVPTAPPPRPPRDPGSEPPAEDRVVADLWHWQDDLVQPMQRVRANSERNRTYRGVYHIAEKRYVQLADPTMQISIPSDDGRTALGADDRAYRRMIDYDGTYSDIYRVDTATGVRTLAVKQLRAAFGGAGGRGGRFGGNPRFNAPLQWSPDGKWALYYQDAHWHVLSAADATSRHLTAGLKVAFHDELDDTPDPAPSYGTSGWTRDSQSVLVYDRYDVWQVFANGRAARNLTEGTGRRTKTQYRVQLIEPADDEEEDGRGIDPAKPLYLRAESEETRATGFSVDSFSGNEPPRQLLWGDRSFRFAGRARSSDVLLVTASRFDEYPDLHTTDPTFGRLTKVTSGGDQKEQFLWGKGELIQFKNADGVALRGALYKPESFDPKKKYPLIVYIYERLSQGLHTFIPPAPGHSINFSYYTSNGYLVLTPDIVYTIGSPGQSALRCVLPAIQKVVDQGFVDESAIGIQGHSWGGYQIAYMVTQTKRFRAAEAGAPVGNMTSAYSGIRWGTGLPRQFQYEKTQSRIGHSLWEATQKFIDNSPVFHVQRVQTPLLILSDDQDDAVPWYQGIELYLALRRNNKEAYLFNYNGEFHGLRRRADQKDFTVRLQQFFDHFLKRAPAPEWMEKGIPFLDREEEKERLRQAAPPRPVATQSEAARRN